MTPFSLLNWAVVSVSMFNTIALIWLGLTVLLNAERPRWGTWAVGGGLLLGGLFFTAHTAAVARGLLIGGRELQIWLRLIWLPFVGGPYLWYLVMAWYTGALLARRHRLWLIIVSVLGLLALTLPLVIEPTPSYEQLRGLQGPPLVSLAGIPAALLVYPVFSLICIALAIAALLRPGATDRFMGDLARRRAMPWLIAASAVLLSVSLSAGGAAAWVLLGISQGRLDLLAFETFVTLYVLDLLIALQIAAAVVLMGMAIVAYEIFTGKTLPRGGLFRYWRNSLILAAGYGVLVGASLDIPVDPIYRLMLATVLMTLFYALVSWRSYAERERAMQRLRPFIASQHLYEHLVGPPAPPDIDAAAPFRALCEEVLDARSAALIPLGALAPFVEPLVYTGDRGAHATPPMLSAELLGRLTSTQTLCVPIDPSHFDGAIWAVPLWSERGLIGVLLIGPKRANGLYTQEEIEVARAAGERLIDIRASAELSRRLVGLQRQRLAESQVIDQRTRRVLHDDVLPQLHTAMILLQSTSPEPSQPAGGHTSAAEVTGLLADVHHQIADLLHDLPAPAGADIARIGLIAALHGAITRELKDAFDTIRWDVDPVAGRRADALPPLTAEVLFFAAREAIRNAARHGRGDTPARPLTLAVAVTWESEQSAQPGLVLTIRDDGVGLGSAGPGQGGAGRGLALHGALLALVGGALEAERRHEGGTQIRILLPPYAVPEPT